MLGGYSLRYVFTDVHVISTFYIGLTLMEIRKLAQVYAVKSEHNIPMSWTQHERARKLFESSFTTIINKS